MKNLNKKRIIIAGLAVVALAIVTVFIGSSLASTSSAGLKDKKVNGLSFENASITYKDKLSNFSVDVYNENKTAYEMSSIDIILTDGQDGKVTLTYEIESLQPDEGMKIIIDSIDYDLSNYTKVSYKINK